MMVTAAIVPWGSRRLTVLAVDQSELGIEIDVLAGDQVNLYGKRSSLRVLADLLDTCAEEGRLAVLHRHTPDGADLVVFRGTDTHIDFPRFRRIRERLRRLKGSTVELRHARPQQVSDHRDDHWRQSGQITVRTQDHVVLLGGTAYGLRLCALDCLHLAETDRTDHEHWDDHWPGTSKTVEFIIRNRDV